MVSVQVAIQPLQEKPFLSALNLESAQRVETKQISPEKLKSIQMFARMDDEKPMKTASVHSRPQQIAIKKDNTLSEEYPEIQNTMKTI